MNTSQILSDIWAERIRQDRKWGGAAHDDNHSAYDFENLITERLAEAHLTSVSTDASGPEYRRRLVQVAALCVAAIERHDRG